MRMRDTFLKPMHPEGYRFVGIFAAITVVLFLIWNVLGWIGVGLTIWCYYFFRDPKRSVPLDETLVLSPADGVVSLIEPAVPPVELGMGPEPLTRVSVFMSVFNCHVNRMPVGGQITAIAYRPGKFFNASMDKASFGQRAQQPRHSTARWPQGRGGADRRPGRAADRVLCQDRAIAALGRPFRPDPLWLAAGCLSAAGCAPMVALGQTMIARRNGDCRPDLQPRPPVWRERNSPCRISR